MLRLLKQALLGLTMAATAVGVASAEPPKRLDVIELFTSQSCSSCPPADKLLGKLAQREDILALSYSVDYWDYLEWQDTLSDAEFSKRQRGYAKRRGDREVYTPQAIVNGTVQTVGSNAELVHAALADTANPHGGDAVALSATRTGESSIVIDIGAAPEGMELDEATVWLVVYVDSRTVKVRAGENKGHTLTYHNVVRRLLPVGRWDGKPLHATVSVPEIVGKRCAVLLQEGGTKSPGAIIAAVRTQ